jgi:hypothetical protein
VFANAYPTAASQLRFQLSGTGRNLAALVVLLVALRRRTGLCHGHASGPAVGIGGFRGAR